jgi:trehalose 6-phosphate synthase
LSRLPKLIVVANRLPVQRTTRGGREAWTPSSGGLVTAMTPILKKSGGAWVGWTGSAEAPRRSFKHDGLEIKPVALAPRDIDAFYHGFSNSTLWPLYHDAIRAPEFERKWWRPYVDVNRRFARAAAAVARRGDIVWVHDYHLQLVPALLRRLRPDLRIGFFLHIPFPPEELFAWLPWRTPLLLGLLGADVIGFQTDAAARNFSRLARQFTTAVRTESMLEHYGRKIRVRAFPISIDFPSFNTLATTPGTTARAAEIRNRIGGDRTLMLAVDRLDYTKGIDFRLRAFEEMLKRRRHTVNDCVLIQIAVPSRENVREYKVVRGRIERMVGRINGEYSSPGRVAVHYFRRSVSRQDLVAYYRAADVLLATPLRDGMNLVAKEYVACHPDNSGVLILSEFAGAAAELRQALLVNPRDLDGMVHTMERALDMSRSEGRQRMHSLRFRVRRHDVFAWAEEFVEAIVNSPN